MTVSTRPHWWASLLEFIVRRVLWRTRTVGIGPWLATGAYLLAINHANVLDGPLVYSVTPRRVHFLVKTEMFRGIFGRILHAIGQIPLDRSGPDRTAMTSAVAALRDGQVVGVFPEGARGRGDVAEVRMGIAWLALHSGAPVVPVAVLGTRRTGQRTGALPRVGSRLHVVFGAPFPVTRLPGVSARQSLLAAAEVVKERLADHVRGAAAATGIALPADSGTVGGSPEGGGSDVGMRP